MAKAPESAPGSVHQARQGDLAAYERLYRSHVGRIHALCLRMTADPGRAEELTQQAFVRAWERLASYREEGDFGAWLRRIAINEVLGERRSRGRRPERPVDDLQAVAPVEPSRSASAAGGIDLERAVAALPARAREVFVLHDVEGYRHEEIAELLGVTPGTSKSQLHRARMLLREGLQR